MRSPVAFPVGGEGAGADARGVGFGDGDDLVDLRRAEAGADTGAARRRVGRGDIGIGAEVDVEQRGLRAFEQDFLAGPGGVGDAQGGVVHIGAQRCRRWGRSSSRIGSALQRRDAVNLGQQFVLIVQHLAQARGEEWRVDKLAHADADAGGLVLIGGADAAPGGAERLAAFALFFQFVEQRW